MGARTEARLLRRPYGRLAMTEMPSGGESLGYTGRLPATVTRLPERVCGQ
jgi:hypothetical protein